MNVVQTISQTKEIWQKDKDHFLHSYTHMEDFPKEGAVVYAKGDRHFIYDNDGKKYIDGIAGLWCVNIGHGRKEIGEVLAQQAEKLAYYNTFGDATTPPAAELAEKLAQITPANLNKVFYGTGGSMANDTAIKIVHYYFNQLGKSKKKKIISRINAYHGSTYLSHALTGIQSSHSGFDLAHDLIHYISEPNPYHKPAHLSEEGFLNHLIHEFEETILRLGPDNVACFIGEPIMGAGGVVVPPAGYYKRMYEVCKKYDMLFIADEVVTAFGRLGQMVASENRFGVQPDLLVMAKGISSGYVPLGATMISDEVYDVLSRPKADNPYFSHGFTYSGHALSCACGLENIRIMEEEFMCYHVRQWGPYFKQELKKLEHLPIVGNVRGSHFMLGVEYVQDKATKTHFDSSMKLTKRIYLKCKDKGLIIRPIGNITVLSPPLTMDKVAIDTTVSILKESIIETISEVF
ncbi:MAG: aminotransferase [Bacteroidota bacterium]